MTDDEFWEPLTDLPSAEALHAALDESRARRAAGDAALSCIRLPGCICTKDVVRGDGGSYVWVIDPDCGYHAFAARFPDDHSIPWNCPTFWDGCNCDDPDFAERADPQAAL